MMPTLRVSALALLLFSCRITPDLEGNGYIECSADDACIPSGRICESGLCTPPTWWKPEYGFRRQLTLTNESGFDLPAGFTVHVSVGAEPRPLKPDEVAPTARFVIMDRAVRAQAEVPVTIDVLGPTAFDVVFQLPVAVKAGATWADLWVYSGAKEGTAVRTDERKKVYPLDDTFEEDLIDDAAWNTVGPVTLPPGDGEVIIQRGGYMWSTAALPASPGIQLTALFTVTPVDSCDGLTIGLVDNNTQGIGIPYVVALATGTGDISIEALRGETLPTEPQAINGIGLKTATQRLDLVVSGANVRATLDGQTIATFVMREPIENNLRAHFFVEGATCTCLLYTSPSPRD